MQIAFCEKIDKTWPCRLQTQTTGAWAYVYVCTMCVEPDSWSDVHVHCTCALWCSCFSLFPGPLVLTVSLPHSSSIVTSSIVFSVIFPSPYLSDMPVLVELRLVWSFQGGFTLSLLAVVRIFDIGFMCRHRERAEKQLQNLWPCKCSITWCELCCH